MYGTGKREVSDMTVKLTKPLSFQNQQGISGYVTELAPTFLMIEGDLSPNARHSISLELSADKHYSFEGISYLDKNSLIKLEISTQDCLESMSDLLGQLRKDQHIEICNNLDVESSDKFTGFSELSFILRTWPT